LTRGTENGTLVASNGLTGHIKLAKAKAATGTTKRPATGKEVLLDCRCLQTAL
jgi:hypothetical protein